VVVAGDFSTAADGLKSWDRVFVHDPAVGAHVRYTAGSWYIENSYQFLSFAAMQGSVWNFNQYGEIHIRGLSDSWRGSDWPPAL